MDHPLLAVAGLALVCLVILDVAWSALAISAGRGPLTGSIGRGLWRLVRGTEHHRVLKLTGYIIVGTLLVTWVLGMWAGWALLFNADSESVVRSSSQEPASVLGKIAYAAGAMAGAGAGLVAASDGWQLANNIAALCGLALFTLAISYLVQLIPAATQRRATAVQIHGLGDEPVGIVAAGAGRPALGATGEQIASMAAELALSSRQHLALPVLHYLHVGERSAAFELGVAKLDEALTIILHALEEDHETVVRPTRRAIDEYLRTASLSAGGVEPPPPPDLTRLAEGGVALDEKRFAARLEEIADRRAALRDLIEANGWRWSTDVCAAA